MAKRKTKAQREAEQYNALLQRVSDFVWGACGGNPMDMSLNPIELSRIIPALEAAFGNEKNGFLWKPWNLDNFNDIGSIVEFLWDRGVRA